MKFDIVVSNPPYDRTDIQIRFALMAHEISIEHSLIIMPAKWQYKGDRTNERIYSKFRETVVPHMRHIKWFLQTTDVFEIAEASGITYYVADKDAIHEYKEVANSCSLNKLYNDIVNRRFIAGVSSLNNKGQVIINKVTSIMEHNIAHEYRPSNVCLTKKFQFWCNSLMCTNGIHTKRGNFIAGTFLPTAGKTQVLAMGEVITSGDIPHDNYNILFSSNSLDEVKSFMSYAYTKFVRFLVFNSIAGLRSTGQSNWWRFVPNQVFDHIFTDKELYKKYKLSDADIGIIENTIAKRSLEEVYSWIPKEINAIT